MINIKQTGPNTKLISGISILIIAGLIGYYLYLVHTGEAEKLINHIRDYGQIGIVIGILVQTIVNIIPVPGEFISIALMEIYGPIWGGIYSWVGGVLGAVCALYLTKWIAKPFFGKLAQPFLHRVEEFTKKHATFGLLLIRFLPLVPYHFVNYTMGFLKINIWTFIWTTGFGILPYTIAMSGIYAGVRNGTFLWGAIGIIVFIVLLGISWLLKGRRKRISNRT
ncbi:TVP38/TMEM64 family protein [Paenibacillus sp. WC2504]|uniref:TVP38/TMEM64 family protein n=1 Tax=Paenibacillus sp. WC2504 TaxID=3461403 RepID=UPI004045400D